MTSRTYAGSSAEERRGSRRAELIEAAVDLMVEEGVGSLTVRGVAAAAGLSPRYLYESFDGLNALRLAAFDDTLVRVLERSAAAVQAAEPDLPSRVGAILDSLLGFARDHSNRARLILTVALGDPALAARRRAMTRQFAAGFAVFVRAQLPDEVPNDRIALAARMLVGATAEVVVAGLEDGGDALNPGVASAMRDLALDLLGEAPRVP